MSICLSLAMYKIHKSITFFVVIRLHIMVRKDIALPGFVVKLLQGAIAGCAGSIVGNPAEVALIRMTADGRLPPGMPIVY